MGSCISQDDTKLSQDEAKAINDLLSTVVNSMKAQEIHNKLLRILINGMNRYIKDKDFLQNKEITYLSYMSSQIDLPLDLIKMITGYLEYNYDIVILNGKKTLCEDKELEKGYRCAVYDEQKNVWRGVNVDGLVQIDLEVYKQFYKAVGIHIGTSKLISMLGMTIDKVSKRSWILKL